MPTKDGRFRGVSIPSVPWHEPQPVRRIMDTNFEQSSETDQSRERAKREAKWPPIGRTPCVTCGHLYGYHARRAGACTEDACDCKAFIHRALGDGTLVVTPEQLRDGYPRNPFIRLDSSRVEHERGDFQVIARYEDGNYLVKEPR